VSFSEEVLFNKDSGKIRIYSIVAEFEYVTNDWLDEFIFLNPAVLWSGINQ